GPVRVAVHGRDGVRLCAEALLEQLVDSAVWQRPVRAGETIELEMQLLAGEQALPRVLGIRVGGGPRERCDVIAGDPHGALRVQHVRSVAQPDYDAVPFRDADPEDGAL